MKIVLLLASSSLMFPLLAQSQQRVAKAESTAAWHCTNSSPDKAIRRIADEWKNGYNNKDALKVGALYSDDAYYLTQHFATGILHGRSDIQAYVQRGIDAGYRIESLEVVATDCSEDMGFAVTRYDAMNGGQKVMGVNLVVVKKIAGTWKIVAHEAAVPEAGAIQTLSNAK